MKNENVSRESSWEGRGGVCGKNEQRKFLHLTRKGKRREEKAPPPPRGRGERGRKRPREKATASRRRGGEISAGVWARWSGEVVGRGGWAFVFFSKKRGSRPPSPSLPLPFLLARAPPFPLGFSLPSEWKRKDAPGIAIGAIGVHRSFSRRSASWREKGQHLGGRSAEVGQGLG